MEMLKKFVSLTQEAQQRPIKTMLSFMPDGAQPQL